MIKQALVIFDFDHTIVDDNTDTVVRKLLPKDSLITAENVYKKTNSWTLYMEQVFYSLHKSNISKEKIISVIQNIPPVKDMDVLIKSLDGKTYETIIISDSNSVFINEWLKFHKLDNKIKKIYTNPSWFDGNGLLNIEFYEHQTSCELSEINLCKGNAMETYKNERKNENVEFKSLVYIGDGRNDFCPAIRLSNNDFVFPRINYPLFKLIEKKRSAVDAQVFPWQNGSDIIKVFQEKL